MTPTAPPAPCRAAAPGAARRRTVALLAAATLLPGLLAACSTDASGAPAATTEADRVAASDAAALGACVRDAGWDVDDADLGRQGIAPLPDGVDGGSADADRYLEAVETCQESVGSGTPHFTDEQTREFDQQLREMAQCLRDAGFDAVEDPVDGVWQSPEQYLGDPAYDAASETCSSGLEVVGR